MGRPVDLEHEFDNYADLIIPGKQTIRRCGVVDRVWLIAECAKWLHCTSFTNETLRLDVLDRVAI